MEEFQTLMEAYGTNTPEFLNDDQTCLSRLLIEYGEEVPEEVKALAQLADDIGISKIRFVKNTGSALEAGCEEALEYRPDTTTLGGIAAIHEFKTIVCSYQIPSGPEKLVAVHYRANRIGDMAKITARLQEIHHYRVTNLKQVDGISDKIGLKKGELNPLSILALSYKNTKGKQNPVLITQIFDEDVFSHYDSIGRMMTNAGHHEWTMEFCPRALVDAHKEFTKIQAARIVLGDPTIASSKYLDKRFQELSGFKNNGVNEKVEKVYELEKLLKRLYDLTGSSHIQGVQLFELAGINSSEYQATIREIVLAVLDQLRDQNVTENFKCQFPDKTMIWMKVLDILDPVSRESESLDDFKQKTFELFDIQEDPEDSDRESYKSAGFKERLAVTCQLARVKFLQEQFPAYNRLEDLRRSYKQELAHYECMYDEGEDITIGGPSEILYAVSSAVNNGVSIISSDTRGLINRLLAESFKRRIAQLQEPKYIKHGDGTISKERKVDITGGGRFTQLKQQELAPQPSLKLVYDLEAFYNELVNELIMSLIRTVRESYGHFLVSDCNILPLILDPLLEEETESQLAKLVNQALVDYGAGGLDTLKSCYHYISKADAIAKKAKALENKGNISELVLLGPKLVQSSSHPYIQKIRKTCSLEIMTLNESEIASLDAATRALEDLAEKAEDKKKQQSQQEMETSLYLYRTLKSLSKRRAQQSRGKTAIIICDTAISNFKKNKIKLFDKQYKSYIAKAEDCSMEEVQATLDEFYSKFEIIDSSQVYADYIIDKILPIELNQDGTEAPIRVLERKPE